MTKKMGRPKLEKGKAKAQFINLRFAADEAKLIDSAADEAKLKRSKWARGILLSAANLSTTTNRDTKSG
jgi:uncharacterized protein (DUF1778 family)